MRRCPTCQSVASFADICNQKIIIIQLSIYTFISHAILQSTLFIPCDDLAVVLTVVVAFSMVHKTITGRVKTKTVYNAMNMCINTSIHPVLPWNPHMKMGVLEDNQ